MSVKEFRLQAMNACIICMLYFKQLLAFMVVAKQIGLILNARYYTFVHYVHILSLV